MGSRAKLQGSLPPGVHGAPRGILKLTVNVQRTNATISPRQLHVRCTWWGDEQVPDAVSVTATGVTVLQWVIRCGSVRFGHYLSDARGLLLSFQDAETSELLGQTVLSLSEQLIEPWRSASASVELVQGALGVAEVQLSMAFGLASRNTDHSGLQVSNSINAHTYA